MILDGKLIDS